MILFGVSPTEEKIISECWPYGFIKVGTCQQESIGYVAGYIVKKMTNPKDQRLKGRTPEFGLMSTDGGIGIGAVERVSKAYRTEAGQCLIKEKKWIEERFRTMGYHYPLGRYLKQKIVKSLGLDGQVEEHKRVVFEEAVVKNKGVTKKQRVAQRQWQNSKDSGKISIRKERKL